jgi:hypothetical protein
MNKKLSQDDKKDIVAKIQAKKASMRQLADRHGVAKSTISGVFKEMTGSALYPHKPVVTEIPMGWHKKQRALQESPYRAWHTEEKKMYPILGIDWFNRRVLGFGGWHPLHCFLLMRFSGLRDKKRTPEYPNGQKIYAGDIVQFPINLEGKKTEIRDVVAFDQEKGMVIVVATDFGDLLCMYNDECEVIGTIQENPELLGAKVPRIRALLKEYTFV